MIKVHEIAKLYNLKLVGDIINPNISSVNSLDNQKKDGLSWVKNEKFLDKLVQGFFLVNSDFIIKNKKNVIYLITEKSTKLVFSQILKNHFTNSDEFYLKNDVNFHRKNNKIHISDNVFIGQNVSIGDGTKIYPNVVIEANSIIGKNCIIKSQVSIGTEGLGLELDKSLDKLISFPQIGNAILNDNVDIGPNSTVRRGALGSTIIKSNSKIGSMVNIGHNCEIGKNCILTCNIVTGGSSVIGDYSFIGLNTVIKNGLNIGENCIIGMGSVVTKNIESHLVAYGNPTKVIRKNK